jgi:DDE superfamily endonuclease
MPMSTIVALSPEVQPPLLAALRRARYGSLLTLPLVLLCAAGRNPTAIAAVRFCSRSRVYRTGRASHAGTLGLERDEAGRLSPSVRTSVLVPTRRRSLLALLKAPPQAYGWCRTRWSGATLAATFQATRGLTGSAETMRRWVHEVGWVWQRATLVATEDAPQRMARLARMRCVYERVPLWEALVCADDRDRHVRPKGGDAWMPQGPQVEVMTPGTHDKHDLAGALAPATGTRHHWVGPRNTNGRFRDLRPTLEAASPAAHYPRLSVVVDHDQIQKAKAVQEWFAQHPRVRRLCLPTYGPRAHPIARAFGEVHDLCTRNHTRTRLQDLVAEVVEPLDVNGPWPYNRSDIYNDPAVTAAVERMIMENTLAAAG